MAFENMVHNRLITWPGFFRREQEIRINFIAIETCKLDVKAFIRELLFSYDCVIIPGFGGFIGNYSPARIDRISGTFTPPLKQISFNKNLSHNDGLLVSRISQATGLNYGNSRNIVEGFVAELNAGLAKGEAIVFDHLGTFTRNIENNIQFEPEPGINYHPGSYGLEPFNPGHYGEYDIRKRVLRNSGRDHTRRVSAGKNLARAAIMIPILALLVIIPLKTQLYDKTRVESVTMNPLVTAEFENNREAIDSGITALSGIKTETAANPDEKASEINTPEPSPDNTPVAVAPKQEEGKFYIITGSFKSEENALSHVNALRKEGFDPEIIRASNGFFRVNAMECNSMAVAMSKKDSLAGKFPGVWISKKKPI